MTTKKLIICSRNPGTGRNCPRVVPTADNPALIIKEINSRNPVPRTAMSEMKRSLRIFQMPSPAFPQLSKSYSELPEVEQIHRLRREAA